MLCLGIKEGDVVVLFTSDGPLVLKLDGNPLRSDRQRLSCDIPDTVRVARADILTRVDRAIIGHSPLLDDHMVATDRPGVVLIPSRDRSSREKAR